MLQPVEQVNQLYAEIFVWLSIAFVVVAVLAVVAFIAARWMFVGAAERMAGRAGGSSRADGAAGKTPNARRIHGISACRENARIVMNTRPGGFDICGPGLSALPPSGTKSVPGNANPGDLCFQITH